MVAPALIAAGIGAAGQAIGAAFGGNKQKTDWGAVSHADYKQGQYRDEDYSRFLENRNWDWQASRSAAADAYGRDVDMLGRQQTFSRDMYDKSVMDSQAAAEWALAQQLQLDNTRVQRLVSDAKMAGIHPLAALGANLNAPIVSAPSGGQMLPASGGHTPSGYVGSSYGGGAPYQPSNATISSAGGWGDAIGAALTGIASAIPTERQLLENELLRKQIASYDVGNMIALADATSRTIVGRARGVGQGGQGAAVLNVGTGPLRPRPDLTTDSDKLPGRYAGGEQIQALNNMLTDLINTHVDQWNENARRAGRLLFNQVWTGPGRGGPAKKQGRYMGKGGY